MNGYFKKYTLAYTLILTTSISSPGIDIPNDTSSVRILLKQSTIYRKAYPDSAFYYSNKALIVAHKTKDDRLISSALESLGNCYIQLENFEKATNVFLDALRIEENLNNPIRIADLSKDMGYIYCLLERFDPSLEYYTKALKLYVLNNDSLGTAKVLMHIGNLYISRQYCEKRSNDQMKQDYEVAVSYYLQSLDLCKKNHSTEGEINCYVNLGNSFKKLEKPTIALGYLQLALEYYEKENDVDGKVSVYFNLAVLYGYIKQYNKAIDYFLKCIDVSNKYNQKQGLQFIYEEMAHTYDQAGQFKNSRDCYIKYMTLRDSIYNSEKSKQIFELETKYQTEKKEIKIASLENERRLIILLSVLGGVLLVSLVILFAARQKVMRDQKKIAEQQIIQLQQEKQLVATHALLEGETIERARLSKDLHDGLGGLLSVTKHKIANMKGSLTIPDDQVAVFNSALEMLDSSITELRRVAHNLMPESLMRYGLNSAISDFCNSIDKVNYHFYGIEKRIDEKMEVAAFRIVNELVNNALKHANASKIDVQLVQEHERISITVYDDGRGFDPKSIDRSKPGGLNNIESRVLSFNGRIDLFSAPEKGTEISVEFKL